MLISPGLILSLIEDGNLELLLLVTACQMFKLSFNMVEVVTQFLARRIKLEQEFIARIRVEIYPAYQTRTMHAQTELTNGAVQVLLAATSIVQMAESSKVAFEGIPRYRTMSSLAWDGVPSGCSTAAEDLYRTEISDIDGENSASLRILGKIIC